MPLSKKSKPINLSLYSDYNPKTTTQGLGFKNKQKAFYTIKNIKNRPIKYQVNVIATMLGRAKNHPNKTVDMVDAIKIFGDWMKNIKVKKMKIKINKYLKKIVVFFLLLIPNGLYADFFEDITNQIVDNPKRLSYGVSVTDVNQDGNFDFVVTGFGFLNLALSYEDGKLINIVKQKIYR